MVKKEVFINRTPSLFELILLLAGLGVTILGFYLIHQQYILDGAILSWNLLISVFLWLLLIIGIILVALLEDVKMELSTVIKEHVEEIRLLQDEDKLLKKIAKNSKKPRKKRK